MWQNLVISQKIFLSARAPRSEGRPEVTASIACSSYATVDLSLIAWTVASDQPNSQFHSYNIFCESARHPWKTHWFLWISTSTNLIFYTQICSFQ